MLLLCFDIRLTQINILLFYVLHLTFTYRNNFAGQCFQWAKWSSQPTGSLRLLNFYVSMANRWKSTNLGETKHKSSLLLLWDLWQTSHWLDFLMLICWVSSLSLSHYLIEDFVIFTCRLFSLNLSLKKNVGQIVLLGGPFTVNGKVNPASEANVSSFTLIKVMWICDLFGHQLISTVNIKSS